MFADKSKLFEREQVQKFVVVDPNRRNSKNLRFSFASVKVGCTPHAWQTRGICVDGRNSWKYSFEGTTYRNRAVYWKFPNYPKATTEKKSEWQYRQLVVVIIIGPAAWWWILAERLAIDLAKNSTTKRDGSVELVPVLHPDVPVEVWFYPSIVIVSKTSFESHDRVANHDPNVMLWISFLGRNVAATSRSAQLLSLPKVRWILFWSYHTLRKKIMVSPLVLSSFFAFPLNHVITSILKILWFL